jgi:transcriptional regulator with XRE-family HTH domain
LKNTNAIVINIISKIPSANKNTDFICSFFKLSYITMNKKRKHNLKMGDKISEARRQIGMTQIEFAEILGVSQQLVTCWEKDSNYPTSEKLPEISKVLGLAVDELLGIKESRHSKKGPQSQVEKSFAKVAKLPKRQQSKILAVVDTMLTVS